MATFRGIPVESVDYDMRADVYRLIGTDGSVIRELSGPAFYSQPQLRTLRHTNGQHRRSGQATYSDPARRSGHSAGRPDQDQPITLSWWSQSLTLTEPKRPTPPAVPYAGIRTGELIGHRMWWVVESAGDRWLSSLAHIRRWNPGEVVEGKLTEMVDSHWQRWIVPLWGGVYAFASKEQLAPEFKACHEAVVQYQISNALLLYVHNIKAVVAGTVKMWGEVVEHEHGYRAQYAKLNSLDAIYGDSDLDALRARYGVGANSEARA